MTTLQDVLSRNPKPDVRQIPEPLYLGYRDGSRAMLALDSMRLHMTDEGHQLQQGLRNAGYKLCGHNLEVDSVYVDEILRRVSPSVVVVQDKREWDKPQRTYPGREGRFSNIDCLKNAHHTFKLTVLKDAHQRPEFHSLSASEIGCHAWITYYHPSIVSHLAPYVRPQHLIRVYHSIDSTMVPPYSANREGCLLSGALSKVYPLRRRLAQNVAQLYQTQWLSHPGYNNTAGTRTPAYLQKLSQFKVAICTASTFGYALRKIIEATACGCRVITDLPQEEVLPGIDNNLIRISSGSTAEEVSILVRQAIKGYLPHVQEAFAMIARDYYDYRASGHRLATAIEQMRASYNPSLSITG